MYLYVLSIIIALLLLCIRMVEVHSAHIVHIQDEIYKIPMMYIHTVEVGNEMIDNVTHLPATGRGHNT